MTRKLHRPTPTNMRFGPLLLATLLGFGVGCDGRYRLAELDEKAPILGDGGRTGDAEPGPTAMSGAPVAQGSGGESGAPAGEAGTAGANESDLIRISPSFLPEARLNRAYSVQLAASGGTEPYRFRLLEGELPVGLALDDSGRLTGTPIQIGDFDLTIEVEDAESVRVAGSFRLTVGRIRWLATETFPASSSSQTLLSLTDLRDPTAASFRIESQSAHSSSFSPDGRWLTYYSFRSVEEVDWYIVNTAGPAPSARKLLLTTNNGLYCSWASDSSKLACPKHSTEVRELVYFDTSGDEPGPAVTLGSSDRFVFVGPNELLFADGAAPYSRVVWKENVPSQPESVGLEGVRFYSQAPDGERAVAVRDADSTRSLVNLRTGEARLLPTELRISRSLDTAVSTEASEADPSLFLYSFYAVQGVDWTLVGQQTGTPTSLHGELLPPLGDGMVLIQGSQLVGIQVRADGLDLRRFAGNFEGVRRAHQSANGEWLYVETGVRTVNQQWDPSSAKHWLSRADDGAQAPQLIAEEFLGGSVAFSPDMQRFYLHGYDSYSPDVVPFLLFDLASDEAVPRTLDIPLNWASSQWSDDSSFVSFIGGSPSLQSRPLLIVDALDSAIPPRTVFECSSNPAPLPGCPNFAIFQP